MEEYDLVTFYLATFWNNLATLQFGYTNHASQKCCHLVCVTTLYIWHFICCQIVLDFLCDLILSVAKLKLTSDKMLPPSMFDHFVHLEFFLLPDCTE